METNLAAIDRLLAREEIVVVDGQELILKLPSEEKIREVRALSSKIALMHAKEEGVTEELFNTASELSILCVSACLNIDNKIALRVLVAAGGDVSELSEKARGLLGLISDDDEEGDQKNDPS